MKIKRVLALIIDFAIFHFISILTNNYSWYDVLLGLRVGEYTKLTETQRIGINILDKLCLPTMTLPHSINTKNHFDFLFILLIARSQNNFFSSVVRIPKERGHVVCDIIRAYNQSKSFCILVH